MLTKDDRNACLRALFETLITQFEQHKEIHIDDIADILARLIISATLDHLDEEQFAVFLLDVMCRASAESKQVRDSIAKFSETDESVGH